MANSEKGSEKPAFLGPHEGRELELMLEGTKHLSYFFFEAGIERDIFPEDEFERLVKSGFLAKDERVEVIISPETNNETTVRNILYATVTEAWRILAMRTVQDIYRRMGPGWRPDLERVIGSLLGYDPEHVEAFIERLTRRK